jgi:hypothetical protein
MDVNVRERASLKRGGGFMKPRCSSDLKRLAMVFVDFNPVRSHISSMLRRWSTDSNSISSIGSESKSIFFIGNI